MFTLNGTSFADVMAFAVWCLVAGGLVGFWIGCKVRK